MNRVMKILAMAAIALLVGYAYKSHSEHSEEE
ncbi:MAG: hypothetical protein FD165_2609 [Gammaproteobacteria bacterium]|nr:MAG: hypothetical protein FD165_2609 [Gammaproteobacteria bacterium]TND01500.1 MAG: hypothetical protein FD120_2570 [Gammaproteobacteria bacterium]